MSETIAAAPARAPWHLWVVGILALLWNGYGGYDYIMTQTQNAAYLAMMTPEQVAYVTNLPAWYTTLWAISVWGAVLASICLLIRRSWAMWLFALSLLCLVINLAASLASAEARALMDGTAIVFTILLLAVAVFELLYSRAMTKRGVLR